MIRNEKATYRIIIYIYDYVINGKQNEKKYLLSYINDRSPKYLEFNITLSSKGRNYFTVSHRLI